MSRSVAEEHIFETNTDYPVAVQILGSLVRDGFLRCHAFCFMPTHYHLLAGFEDGQLAPTIQRLNRRYAGGFNRRHHRRGHVFDSPYQALEVDSDSYLMVLAAYLALNPRDPLTWPWSSYLGTIGLREPFAFVDPAPLLDVFGSASRLRHWIETEAPAPGTAELTQVPRPPSYRARRIVTAPSSSAARSKPLRS
jgi:putative transposase